MLNLTCTIRGIAPYSQSQKLDDQKENDEGADEFERRIWRQKAHVGADGDSIVIPGHAIHQALVVGAQKGRLKPSAKTSNREGLKSRLTTGIAIMGDAQTSMSLKKATCAKINAHVNGKRGSSSRVTRLFPEWGIGWTATFSILILDDSVTQEDVAGALKWAGLVAGLGRFRPECMGHNGRFLVENITASQLGVDDLAKAA